MKKIINSILAIATTFSFTMLQGIPINALEEAYQEDSKPTVNYPDPLRVVASTEFSNVKYSYEDNYVIEETTYENSDSTLIATKTIYSDNTYTLEIISGDEVVNLSGSTDYNVFYNYYLRSCNSEVSETFIHDDAVSLLGSDITNSNFIHLQLGRNSYTINRSDIERLNTYASVYSYVAGIFPALPGGVIAWTADLVLSEVVNQSPYKMTISETAYEVRFKSDNNYYCMCYHDLIYSYNSAGKRISLVADYYQTT